MSLLLDTHIWLWGLLEPERLTPRVKRALEAPDAALWLSPISTWEALLLVRKKRLLVDGEPDAWIENALALAPLQEAPLTFEIAIESGRVKLPHPDPADRFLVATARVLNLTLVTADKRILRARPCPLLPNA